MRLVASGEHRSNPDSVLEAFGKDLAGIVFSEENYVSIPPEASDTESPSKPKGRQLSIKELEELSASDIDEETAKEGFIDEDGEVTYIIDKIIKYEPKRGYYVKWKGYGDGDNTWQSPDSMPVDMREEMKAARDRYSEEKRRQRDRFTHI